MGKELPKEVFSVWQLFRSWGIPRRDIWLPLLPDDYSGSKSNTIFYTQKEAEFVAKMVADDSNSKTVVMRSTVVKEFVSEHYKPIDEKEQEQTEQ